MSARRMAAGLLLAGVLLWPGLGRGAVRPTYGGAAVLEAEGPLASWDPALARSSAERLLAEAAHAPLTDLLTGPPEVSADGLRWTFRLRPGLVFHDGTRLTAEDAARSLARVAEPALGAPAAWRLSTVSGVAERLAGEAAVPAIRAVDAHTLVLDLTRPDAGLARRLDDPRLAVLAPDGRTGCGPFLVRTRSADRVELVPFDRHPAGRPFLDRLVVRLPRDGTSPPDGALGRRAPPEAELRAGGSTGTFLVVRHPGGAALAWTLARLVDPPALARYLAGPGARPFPSADRPEEDAPPLPPRLSLAYDPAVPEHRAVAERIQLRLHDQGVAVQLLAGSAGDLSLVTVPLGPGPEAEGEAIQALARPEAAPRDRGTLAVVPLFQVSGRVALDPTLMGGRDGRVVPVDPAGLWRWPLPSPPPTRP